MLRGILVSEGAFSLVGCLDKLLLSVSVSFFRLRGDEIREEFRISIFFIFYFHFLFFFFFFFFFFFLVVVKRARTC